MCVRVLVSGRVQGVGYRNFTRRVAHALAVQVEANNLADGRVEVHACGPTAAVEALLCKLAEGPAWSRVDDLHREHAACHPQAAASGSSQGDPFSAGVENATHARGSSVSSELALSPDSDSV